MAFEFYVNTCINNPNFDPLGSGPLTSVTRWSYTAGLDRAGRFEFDFAANDAQAEHVTNGRAAKAHALLDGVWTEVGIGIVEVVNTVPDTDGNVTMRASGLDIIGELGYKNVRVLEIGAETGTTLEGALVELNALANVGWVFLYLDASIPENDYFYAKFDGESLLGALIYLAEKTQVHFTRGNLRVLNFSEFFTDSGVRAIQAQGALTADQCAITGLTRTVDTSGLLTRIYPYGSGDDRDTSLNLSGTTRVAPVGFTLNTAENYIENNAATTAYGLRDFPEVAFKEISTISNTDADYAAASDFLFDVALAELRVRSTLAAQETYTLTVAGCNRRLAPLQTLRLVYRDPAQGIDIDEDLYILEATWEMDSAGIRTTRLVVSTHDKWPKSSANATDRVVQGRIFQAHPQNSLNEYWVYSTLFVGPDTINHIAAFPFVLGRSVVMVKQVLFRFKVEAVLTGAYTYALASGQTDLNAPEPTGPTNTLDTDVSNISVTDGTAATINDASVAITPTTVTVNNETVVVNDTAAGIGGTAATVDSAAVTVTTTGATALDPETPDTGGPNTGAELTATNYGSVDLATQGALSENPGEHWHDMSGHQHEHIHHHTVASHTHTIDAEHGHSAGSHSHTSPSHSHTSPAHGHTAAAHNHTTVGHTHLLSDHNHTSAAHTHGVLHVHAMQHNHDSPQHPHGLPDLIGAFALTRAAASRTYVMADLEYAVNGGAWADLSDATAAGDYFELDITEDVTSLTIPFRPAQTDGNNVIEIRRKSAAGNFTLTTIEGVAGTVTGVTSAAHGMAIGDQIAITGTTAYNGTRVVVDVPNGTTFVYLGGGTGVETSGTVNLAKSAMILAQLGIRTSIQAVSA